MKNGKVRGAPPRSTAAAPPGSSTSVEIARGDVPSIVLRGKVPDVLGRTDETIEMPTQSDVERLNEILKRAEQGPVIDVDDEVFGPSPLRAVMRARIIARAIEDGNPALLVEIDR